MDKTEHQSSIEQPLLSIVVIGRNEGERLVRCLQSVVSINLPGQPIEVIYVDSSSTDNSVERARGFGATVIQVHPERPCAAVGRNAGWRIARSAIVLFLDGDTILAPDFVSSAIPQFEDPTVAVVFGDRREINTDNSIYNRVLDLDWITERGSVELCGGDALIRRDVLERVNGYDERLIAGEDAELSSRIRELGFKIIHLDQLMVRHDLCIRRFSQYWKRSVRTGYAFAEVSERFRGSAFPTWSQQARENRYKGTVIAAILVGAVLLSYAMRSAWPVLGAVASIAALSIRTAMRTRWKRADLATRLLHGVHSHIGQIPILCGQLQYRRDRLFGLKARLIEYKE